MQGNRDEPKLNNLNKTREETIFELLLSINQGNSYYVSGDQDCIWYAINQYDRLVEEGVIKELDN